VNLASRSIPALETPDISLLDARPTVSERRFAWGLISLLLIGFLLAIPISAQQWTATNLLFAAAGIACFVEIATGTLLFTQANILRNDAILVLALAYLLGGSIIGINLLMVNDVPTQLWLFRVWHSVFVLGVLGYAWLATRERRLFTRSRFSSRMRYGLLGIGVFLGMVVLYLVYRPFALPAIISETGYVTPANLWANGIQLVLIMIAGGLLVRQKAHNVLTLWMAVVATAVFIDIVLFVLGGKLFSAGLYLSKLNNLIAGTLIFWIILYHYLRIQRALLRNRVWLLRTNQTLKRRSLSDPLTGLPNRACLEQHLSQALYRAERRGTESLVAVCLIDLDNFKPVNDHHGHEIGDRLLSALSQRLTAVLRKGEFLARLGGDEFVLVLEDLGDIEELQPIMDRIARAMARPFVLDDDLSLSVNISIGVAVYPQVRTAEELMRRADQALYRSKDAKDERQQSWQLDPVEALND